MITRTMSDNSTGNRRCDARGTGSLLRPNDGGTDEPMSGAKPQHLRLPFRQRRSPGSPQPVHKNMQTNKYLNYLCCTSVVFALCGFFAGCGNGSKPDLNDVKSVIQDQYGECAHWTIGDIERLDGVATNNRGVAAYGVKYSFVLSFKDPGFIESTVRPVIDGHESFKPGPCIYGLDLVVRGVDLTHGKLAARYKVTVISIFVRSEQGWHLIDDPNASVAQDMSPLDDPDDKSGASTPVVSSSSEPAGTGSTGEQLASNAAGSNAAPAVVIASNSQAASASAAPVSPAPLAVPLAVTTGTPAPAGGNAGAAQEAPVSQPAAPAVEPPAAQPPVAHPLAAADLEGDWQGTYQCGPYIGSGSVSDPEAWTQHVTMTVRDGQVALVRESEGDRAFREVLSGNVLPDLSLHLGGTGQHITAKHPWNADFMGRFNGTGDTMTFEASGTLSDWHREEFRACRLSLSR
jgi:hypothetical protein